MEDILLMSRIERDRAKILERVKAGLINIKQAAGILHISYRHCRRIYKRFLLQGDKGLLHRSRGKPSNRAISPETINSILTLYKKPSVLRPSAQPQIPRTKKSPRACMSSGVTSRTNSSLEFSVCSAKKTLQEIIK